MCYYMHEFSSRLKLVQIVARTTQFQFPEMAFLFFITKWTIFVSENAESIRYLVDFLHQPLISCMVPSRLRIPRISTFLTPFSCYAYFHRHTPPPFGCFWYYVILPYIIFKYHSYKIRLIMCSFPPLHQLPDKCTGIWLSRIT